jgi:hypothetical protein
MPDGARHDGDARKMFDLSLLLCALRDLLVRRFNESQRGRTAAAAASTWCARAASHSARLLRPSELDWSHQSTCGKGEMPPYTSKVASDKEVGDIVAFLQTIPQPPVANSISFHG